MLPKQRIYLILAISIGLHLVLLSMEFRSGPVVGHDTRHMTALVSGNTADFQPSRASGQITSLEKPQAATQVLTEQKAGTTQDLLRKAASKAAVKTLRTVSQAVEKRSDPQEQNESPAIVAVATASTGQTDTEPLEATFTKGQMLANSMNKATNSSAKQAFSSLPKYDKAGGGDVFQSTPAVPRYERNPKPVYPEVARRRGWQGEVLLLVHIDSAGDVDTLVVKQSSGYGVLDRAAKRSVRLWQFSPARMGGEKIASDAVVPVSFMLPGEDLSQRPQITAVVD